MSRPSTSANNSVSLFPFLAVLICAMGALIFLLIVTTRRIRHNAIEQAEMESSQTENPIRVLATTTLVTEKQTPAAPKIIDKNDSITTEIKALKDAIALKRKLNQTLTQSVSAAKSLVEKSQSSILAAELRIRKQQESTQKIAKVNQSILMQHQEIQAKTALYLRNLKSQKQQTAHASSKYQFVPFEGHAGTTRRPILVECTSESIRFVQEDVILYPNDLNGFYRGV